jgi:hypothetical protein
MIRHAVANLILRLREVVFVDFMTRDVMNAVMNHVIVYQNGKRKSKSAQFIEESVIQEYQDCDRVHFAVKFGDNESIFLRKLSELIIPHLLPPKYVNCSYARTLIREITASLILAPVIDAISNPSFVNKILIDSSTSDSGHAVDSQNQCDQSELLVGYSPASHCGERDGALGDVSKMSFGIPLKQVVDDAQMLFLFMQFLKEEGAVNLIQFHLAHETLSLKLMNPDPSHADIENLVSEAKALYKSFIDPESIDCISFSNSGVESDVRNILNECEKNIRSVDKLRTCESLYSASFEVNWILEKYFLDVFFETSFYLKMVSGPRWPSLESAAYSLMAPDVIPKKFHPRHRRQASMTSLKRVVKESFWPSPDDGLIPPSASFNSFSAVRSSSLFGMDRIENGIDLLEGFDYNDRQTPADNSRDSQSVENPARVFKSMKDWRISVPEIATRLDSGLKYFHVFVIDVNDKAGSGVQKDDSVNKSWRVERRFNEFYTLESKLKEFHGESLQTYQGFYPLPSRNWSFISTPKQTIHFLDTKREDLEKFLSSLVTCDKLCGSQLVYNFLSDSAEFIPSSIADALSIKKIMKNVPAKLTSEKGQNLDPFLASLVQSAMGPVHELDDDDDSGYITSPEELSHNLISSLRVSRIEFPDQDSSRTSGAFDLFLFLLIKVLDFSPTSCLVTAVVAMESVVRCTLDSLLTSCMRMFYNKLIEPHFLTNLLRKGQTILKQSSTDVVSGRSVRDKRQETEREALCVMRTRVKELFPVLLPDEKIDEIAFLFYSILQHQRLNKQLLYLFLDSLVIRAFPHLVSYD